MKVLSGIQPSGRLHLGNYVGMMRRVIERQCHHELYVFIVNLHALTTVFDGKTLRENSLMAAADFLALGLDPEKTIFWIQSDVPEVMELTWYLSTVTPFGLLERGTSFKDKVERGISSSMGLFSYPVLMAADILLFQADMIPVGKDQKQHLEMTRDIAIKFNQIYGETFTVPEPDIEEASALVPGIDGQKMSKSYDNTIELFSDPKALKKRVMSIKTDSKSVEEKKNPEECIIFHIFKVVASPPEVQEMARRLNEGHFGYGDAKKMLLEKLTETFMPLLDKRNYWLKHTDDLMDILHHGAKKAREKAAPTLESVRQKVGVKYRL